MKTKPTAEIREHYDKVARLGCLITHRSDPTIHHAHGGSVGERLSEMGLSPVKGMGMRGYSDWLVIPLAAELHCMGPLAIDGGIGVREWENRFGKQSDLIDLVGDALNYSLWEKYRAELRT